MKEKKKKIILIICYVLIIVLVWLLNTDRYIRKNITTIDKADSINVITEDKSAVYPFDEELIKLLSYGGFVIKADNFFEGLFAPYSNKLTKVDMSIKYTKDDSTLVIAEVFYSNENSEEYILYMNNIYWSTHSKLTDLLKLTK